MVLSSVGQSFTINSDATLGYVKFVTYRGGVNNNPKGFLIARLYHGVVSGSGIVPIDNPINFGILAVSNVVNMEDLTGVDWDTFTFSGSQQYNLKADVVYVIQVAVLSATVLDSTNNVWVHGPTSNCVAGVESVFFTGTWKTYASYDVCVQVYDINDNLLYECPLTGCVAYGYDILDTVHPRVIIIEVKNARTIANSEYDVLSYTTSISIGNEDKEEGWFSALGFMGKALRLLGGRMIRRAAKKKEELYLSLYVHGIALYRSKSIYSISGKVSTMINNLFNIIGLSSLKESVEYSISGKVKNILKESINIKGSALHKTNQSLNVAGKKSYMDIIKILEDEDNE